MNYLFSSPTDEFDIIFFDFRVDSTWEILHLFFVLDDLLDFLVISLERVTESEIVLIMIRSEYITNLGEFIVSYETRSYYDFNDIICFVKNYFRVTGCLVVCFGVAAFNSWFELIIRRESIIFVCWAISGNSDTSE